MSSSLKPKPSGDIYFLLRLVNTCSSDSVSPCCRGEEAVDATTLTKVVKGDEPEKQEEAIEAPAEEEIVRYKKLEVMKKGNKTSFPQKGDMGDYYTI